MSVNLQKVKSMFINDNGSVTILYIILLNVNTEGKLECKCGILSSQFRGFAGLYRIQFLEVTLKNNVKQACQRACMLTFHLGEHLLAISDTPDLSFTPDSNVTERTRRRFDALQFFLKLE